MSRPKRQPDGFLGRGCTLALTLLVGVGAAAAKADEVRIHRLNYTDVKVTGIENGQLVMLNRAGNPIRKPLHSVTRVQLTGNNDFNRAEILLEQQKYRLAWQRFELARQRTNVEWLHTLIDLRLLEAYQRDGQFARAVEVFTRLARRFPQQARQLRPKQLPTAGSQFNQQAIQTLDSALAECRDPAARTALLELLVAVLETEGSDRLAEAAGQLAKLLAPATEAGSPPASQGTGRRMPRLSAEALNDHLTRARALLQAGQYAAVVRAVDAVLPEARDQFLAQLWMLKARALQALGESAQAALAAMHVVIQQPDSPLAPSALALTAAYYESLGRKDKAGELYQELCNHPAADADLIQQAQQAIARLEAEQPEEP